MHVSVYRTYVTFFVCSLSFTKQHLDAKLARHCHHEHSVVSNLHEPCGSCWVSLHVAMAAGTTPFNRLATHAGGKPEAEIPTRRQACVLFPGDGTVRNLNIAAGKNTRISGIAKQTKISTAGPPTAGGINEALRSRTHEHQGKVFLF